MTEEKYTVQEIDADAFPGTAIDDVRRVLEMTAANIRTVMKLDAMPRDVCEKWLASVEAVLGNNGKPAC